MSSEPLPTGLNGRDGKGRFGRGNHYAKGNPLNKRVQQLRNALLRAVTAKDLREVAKALLEKARGGDVAAARELMDRVLGKPAQALELTTDGNLGAQAVVSAVLQALDGHPEVKAEVAAKLMEAVRGTVGANGAGS